MAEEEGEAEAAPTRATMAAREASRHVKVPPAAGAAPALAVFELRELLTPILCLAASPNGLLTRRVVTASLDQTVRLWDAETGALQKMLEGHTGGVRSCAFSPDGERVFTGSDDGTARLWSVVF